MKVRKIKIETWTEPERDENGKTTGRSVDVDTCFLVRNMVSGLPPDKLPRGVDAFNIMKDLSYALRDAQNQQYLLLPENVYNFLQKNCFPNIPAAWGLMEDISNAVTLLIGAELVEVKIEREDIAEEEKLE